MYLGIDVGTQSVKTVLYDSRSRSLVGVASSALELTSGADGTREQLAHWWLDALGACLDALEPDSKAQVRAIGVSGQQHGLVPLSSAGEVTAPVKLWCDTATTAECDQITAALGGQHACIAELGNPILPGYTASKILWLKNHRPEAYAGMATILLPHDYVNFYLTGERCMEYGDASGTGLMDVRKRCWHPGVLEAIDDERDLVECLPQPAVSGGVIGRLRDAVADELGLPRGTPVSPGGGDNMMAAIGSGNVSAGAITISLGTSGTLFAYSDVPVVSPDGAFAAFCSSTGGWLPLVCTMNCTVATEATRQLLDLPLEELDALAGSAAPGAGGIVSVPFFNGERSPNLPGAKGCVFGLDEQNYTRSNLLRSAMEASVFGLKAGLASLQAQGLDASEVRLTGGGAQSVVWRQLVADVLGLPATVQCIDEGAALGAALQALWVDGGGDSAPLDISGVVQEHLEIDAARSCEPEAGAVEQYAAHYERYQRHVNLVTELYGAGA